MRVLLSFSLLLVGIAGCGDGFSPSPESSRAKVDKPPARVADADAVAALGLGAKIERNQQGEVVEVDLNGTQVTDAGLVHLKGMTKLKELGLEGTGVTDAGVMHLKGLTTLEELRLYYTRITGAGIAELGRALPNCKIKGQ